MKNPDFNVWWHSIAALPETREDHAYHVLRRVWGDHTITGARSFYRRGSEDNVTSTLFQQWSLLSSADWVASLVRSIGGTVGTVRRVRWAYEVNEYLDSKLQPHHGRNFVIADLMLAFEDEHGLGLVAFEVKKPGTPAQAKDERKLRTYVDLPSTRRIDRRYGCLLVSENVADRSSDACGQSWPVLTWETLRDLQCSAVATMGLSATASNHVDDWIRRHYWRCGVDARAIQRAPDPAGPSYGSADGYRAIKALCLPRAIERFLMGSECVEAVAADSQPDPPLEWLAKEPSVQLIRERGVQTSPERHVCRWSFDWTERQERTWRLAD